MKKQEKTICGFPPAKRKYTSYGGITHIRLKGRRCFLPLSLSTQAPLFFQLSKIKTGDALPDAAGKKSMNHDFLRRHYPHQVKGSKFDYFLSACKHKLPCFYFVRYYTTTFVKIQDKTKKIPSVNDNHYSDKQISLNNKHRM